MYLIGAILLYLIMYLNLRVSKKLLYPPVIFSIIWLVVIVLHGINSLENVGILINPLNFKTILFIVSANLIFSISSFVSYLSFFEKVQLHKSQYKSSIDNLFFEILFIVSILITILYVFKSIEIASRYDFNPFIKELRIVINYHGESYGWLKYAGVIVNINFFIRLLLHKKMDLNKTILIISFLLALLVAFLNTGRTYVFFVLIFPISYWLISVKIKFKQLIIIGLIAGVFFALIGFLTEKGAELDSDLITNIASMYSSFMEYLLGPISAFQEELMAGSNFTHGENSLRFFNAVLYKFSLIESPATHFQEFTNVPFRTNVYTVFSPYYRDFGLIGVIIFLVVIGYLYGLLYSLSFQSKLFYKYLFFLSIYPLVICFFDDQYMTILSIWLQYIVWSTIIFGLFIYRKKV